MRRVACLTALSLVLTLAVVACSEEPPPSTQGVGTVLPTPPPREVRQDPIYDNEGVPRESEERVAGLTLPLGIEEVEALRQDRRHVYTSVVPPGKMLRYFGPRLNTVTVESVGDRVIYRDATVQGAQGGVVRLDVTIEPTSSDPTRIEIFERPPPPPEGTVITEEAVREHFEELARDRE